MKAFRPPIPVSLTRWVPMPRGRTSINIITLITAMYVSSYSCVFFPVTVSCVPLFVFLKIALPNTPLLEISIMFTDALSFLSHTKKL